MLTLRKIIEQSYAIAKKKGWHDQQPENLGERLLLVSSELAEAFEHYRHGHDPSEIFFTGLKQDKPDGFPVEIADALIRLVDICKTWNVPLEKAYKLKTAYNKTRAYRHGGLKA